MEDLYSPLLLVALGILLSIWLRRIDYELQRVNRTLREINSKIQ